jgi:hypothetical protein
VGVLDGPAPATNGGGSSSGVASAVLASAGGSSGSGGGGGANPLQMLTSAATFALVSGAYRARGYKWDWAVFGVLAVFVYLYVVCVTCAVRADAIAGGRETYCFTSGGPTLARVIPAVHHPPCCPLPPSHPMRTTPPPPPAQILPWLSVSVPGISNLALLSGTTALAAWCFVCCILFDPGR